MAFGEVVIRYNKLPTLSAALESKVKKIVADAALKCVELAVPVTPWISSTLRKSLHAQPDDSSGLTWSAGTDVEYARRIEFGFMGADSLGRVYHQAPQPYLTPAAETVRPIFLSRMRAAVEDAAR